MESRSNVVTNIFLKRITRLVIGAILFAVTIALLQSPSVAMASAQLPRHSSLDSNHSLGLIDFGGKVKSQKIQIYWDTGTEVNIAGFNVWKRTGNGTLVRLNANIVPARIGSASGNSYSLLDKKVKRKVKYTYQLEVVTVDGYSAWSDQISLKVR